jgi:hypothetical protein
MAAVMTPLEIIYIRVLAQIDFLNAEIAEFPLRSQRKTK